MQRPTPERAAELAAMFWQSDEGAGALAGARLDNPAILPHFLAQHVELASDDEIEWFYGLDPREEDSPYGVIKRAVIDAWPSDDAAATCANCLTRPVDPSTPPYCRPCGLAGNGWEPDIAKSVAAPTWSAPYRVRPFSGGDEGRESYNRHAAQAGDRDPCVICGRVVLNARRRVTVSADMADWAPDDADPNGGCFAIGPDCHRKYQAVRSLTMQRATFEGLGSVSNVVAAERGKVTAMATLSDGSAIERDYYVATSPSADLRLDAVEDILSYADQQAFETGARVVSVQLQVVAPAPAQADRDDLAAARAVDRRRRSERNAIDDLAVGDPVVVAGTKYRVRHIESLRPLVVLLAHAPARKATHRAYLARLEWERRVGLWRAHGAHRMVRL